MHSITPGFLLGQKLRVDLFCRVTLLFYSTLDDSALSARVRARMQRQGWMDETFTVGTQPPQGWNTHTQDT